MTLQLTITPGRWRQAMMRALTMAENAPDGWRNPVLGGYMDRVLAVPVEGKDSEWKIDELAGAVTGSKKEVGLRYGTLHLGGLFLQFSFSGKIRRLASRTDVTQDWPDEQ